MNIRLTCLIVTAALLTATSTNVQAQSTINLIVPGPADWSDPANWDINDVPGGAGGDPFPQDVVGISNSGVAFLEDAAPFPVDGLILGEDAVADQLGTLEIRDGGSLIVTPGGGTAGGAVLVGQGAGTGLLNMLGGSSLAATSINVGGAGGSSMSVQGTATIQIGGDAVLSRNFTLSGPDVTFEVGEELTIDGSFLYAIDGAADSTINAPFGDANLNGTLTVTVANHAPALGDSWRVVNAAALNGQFQSFNLPAAPAGLAFAVNHDPAAGDVTIDVENRLVLTVDRSSGAAVIGNRFGAIDMKGYTISSPAGRLDRDAWTSLDDQMTDGNRWFEANPTANNLSELNLEGMTSLAADQSVGIGAPYDFTPAAFGDTVPEDLSFEYATASGERKSGTVVFEGDIRHNNLVLTVDPTTGEAAILNPSFFEVDINGYVISSSSGSLVAGQWNSFEDQGLADNLWFEANPTANNLSELSLEGMTTLAIGSQFSIGNPFDETAGTQDLTFQFNLIGSGPMFGIVQYGEIPSVGQPGDTNGDGFVNIDDLNNVRNNFGANGPPDGSLQGDAFPFDGIVNIDDLNGVRNNFGAGPGAVPEPSSFLLACLGFVFLWRRRA